MTLVTVTAHDVTAPSQGIDYVYFYQAPANVTQFNQAADTYLGYGTYDVSANGYYVSSYLRNLAPER